MDESLDQVIRNRSISMANMSLDEYITMKNIKKPHKNNGMQNRQETSSVSGVSKFDRYKNQDEDDDDMDEDGAPKQMPKLEPYVQKKMPAKESKSVHDRLGVRSSVCESIHTSRMKLFQPNFKAKNRKSVQQRLGKNWVNPATAERNRIVIHALNSGALNNMVTPVNKEGSELLNAFAMAIGRGIDQTENNRHKYNMALQKEISQIQGKPLYFASPGGFVVSCDGPGVRGLSKVPTHQTNMSLNQRFA